MVETISENMSLRPCVLIVEDDDAVRRSLQLLLRANGLDARAFSSAAQALADPRTREAECLVADLVMPEVDGIELLEGLRKDGWQGPAVLISGYLTDPLEKQAKEAGFAVILQKPLREHILVESVRTLISRREGEQNLTTA